MSSRMRGQAKQLPRQALLLLAVVSLLAQPLGGAAMACKSDPAGHQAVTTHHSAEHDTQVADMTHAHHGLSQASTADPVHAGHGAAQTGMADAGCCGSDCECPSGSCHTPSTLVLAEREISAPAIAAFRGEHGSVPTRRSPFLPFKPPIFS